MPTEGLCTAEGPLSKEAGRTEVDGGGCQRAEGQDRETEQGWPDTRQQRVGGGIGRPAGLGVQKSGSPHGLLELVGSVPPVPTVAARWWPGRASLKWPVILEGALCLPLCTDYTDPRPRAGTSHFQCPAQALAQRRCPINVG